MTQSWEIGIDRATMDGRPTMPSGLPKTGLACPPTTSDFPGGEGDPTAFDIGFISPGARWTAKWHDRVRIPNLSGAD